MVKMVDIQNVTKILGQKTVLQDLSLNISEGSVVGLLGKNGAGKTTLLKCLLGFLRIDQGKILTLNENPWEFSAKVKNKIGFVPQSYRPYPWLQAGALIDYTASFYAYWNKTLVNRLVKEWELDLSNRISVLSEGEMQKLLIILSLGHEPELLVFDEPVASLDPTARRQFLRTILDIVSERKCTVFFSTHITSDLERIADTVAVLKSGNIDFVGGLDELKDTVKRIRFRSHRLIPADLSMEGVIVKQINDHDALLTVRDFNQERLEMLEKAFDTKIEVEDLNLEEIFLEIN